MQRQSGPNEDARFLLEVLSKVSYQMANAIATEVPVVSSGRLADQRRKESDHTESPRPQSQLQVRHPRLRPLTYPAWTGAVPAGTMRKLMLGAWWSDEGMDREKEVVEISRLEVRPDALPRIRSDA